MCGILGIWHVDGRAVDLARLQRANDTLRHRGPDDEGYLLVDASGRIAPAGGEDTDARLDLPPVTSFAGRRFELVLAHRRLSILDLSPAGHQPMADRGGDRWIVYNGEVYNYVELRRELRALGYGFRTETDTEVILAAYDAWGRDCLRRFNGMWAFALWDGRKRELFCARDRFGIKPFHYFHGGGTLVFASEPKALLECPGVPRRPNDEMVYDFLTQKQEDHTDDTFFAGLRKLPPGHFMRVTADGCRLGKWWSPELNLELGDAATRNDPAVREHFLELLEDAIRLRLRSDVPLGTCLSGGLDSSTIVCLANRLIREEGAVAPAVVGDRQKTFSARFHGSRLDEGEYIRPVVAATGAAAHDVYPGDNVSLFDELTELVRHQDEPFASTSIYAQWNVMRLAQQNGVTVLLDGQGADELLAGYHRYYGAHLAQFSRERGLPVAWHEACLSGHASNRDPRLLLAWGLRDRVRGHLRPWMRPIAGRLDPKPQRWIDPDFAHTHRDRRRVLRAGLPYDSLARSLDLDIRRLCLPALLRYEDRNSMAFSREARVPFLDYRLVEYVFSLPACFRLGGGWTKWLLRHCTAGLVPDAIRWRKSKIGFVTPESDWLREGGSHLEALLSDNHVRSAPYVRPEVLRAAHPLTCLRGVWRWAALEIWLRTFFG